MFPTFSGTSRRPRNVNLSGQRSDPFAGTSWGAGPSTGTTKSVAEAQADRQRRQQERDRLRAAQNIQRTWRGHHERQALQAERRRLFNDLYRCQPPLSLSERVSRAFPLLPSLIGADHEEDYEGLTKFTEDLAQDESGVFSPEQTPTARLKSLVRMLVATAIKTEKPAAQVGVLLKLLVLLVERRPESAADSLDSYYTLLAHIIKEEQLDGHDCSGLPLAAISLPLGVPSDIIASKAYRAFVAYFLTSPDLKPVEEHTKVLVESIEPERLSAAVVDEFSSGGTLASAPKDNLLWLLARFIDIQRAQSATSQTSAYAKALHLQLSNLASEIRTRFTPLSSRDSPRSDAATANLQLPHYVSKQLSSLVERGEISNLLSKFVFNYGATSSQPVGDASILAGYILTLIRCFPSRGDDIRMRLYLADIAGQSEKQKLPSIKFFWEAVKTTTVFSRVIRDEKSAHAFLLQRTYFQTSSTDSAWDREWRTVLLFLELYVFVLRLTDDEDFFSGISGTPTGGTPRLAGCSLLRGDLENLSLFLKNLGFTLYHHAADLLQVEGTAENAVQSLDDVVRLTPTRGKTRDKVSSSFTVISGIDFEAFRNIAITTIRMLYERDSRRPFLPPGHWLMTSRFDMDSFLSAVVLEEQRQHDIRGNDSEEEVSDEDEELGDMLGSSSHQVFSWAGQRRSRHAMVEQFKTRQKKLQRDRTLAVIGPKLEILRNMPFVIPFEKRVQIFRQFVHLDKERRRHGHVDADQWRQFVLSAGSRDPIPARGVIGRHHAKIKRGNVFDDAYDQFYPLGDGLKEPIQITFVDQFDTIEAGIDGGGVTKEFLTSITTEAFGSSQHNLFVANGSNAMYPNPSSLDQLQESLRDMGFLEGSDEWTLQVQTLLEQYEFLGRIVGKCMYEGILIDIAFAGFFLLKWVSAATDLGYRASINDVREMDEELYQGLLRLKNMQSDVSELELDFTINDQVSATGEETVTITRDLMPNGKDVAVTNENRPLYISYVARHRLVAQPYQQTRAFLRGLGSIIDPAWLCMFNQSELQRLVGGDSSEIDLEDLRKHTVYSGVYEVGDDGKDHPTIDLFWQAMHEFQDSERRDVLKYVTSTPRAPLLGFFQLKPLFSIRDGGGDPERLPSAATCINLLKLPRYPTLEILKNKLRYAVSSNAGFDLS
ncbi:hypothetical protein GGTG_00549 [Gaeumannomyces tritici R3-111a-1]|uniref:HECT-type E3 ubiquitin transferase n=1 Tax=Gaeumannomyces tritici (strain R3-111a-1) TaxID=644352 RepID=J3NH14_GAET3|nr:hypothetical protein GGTG_00549 [Gaeumannomyces tritici R3-111a-1]EJT80554.1 hypothetical protein GGTG_00549 [Gaeumannomyces tritici R3-111a-1]